MAHTDRQPSQEIFEDIQSAAIQTWVSRDYHRDYIREKLDKIYDTENYADNWYSFIGAMDSTNQIVFIHCIRRQATMDFLREQRVHYSYALPRELE